MYSKLVFQHQTKHAHGTLQPTSFMQSSCNFSQVTREQNKFFQGGWYSAAGGLTFSCKEITKSTLQNWNLPWPVWNWVTKSCAFIIDIYIPRNTFPSSNWDNSNINWGLSIATDKKNSYIPLVPLHRQIRVCLKIR